MQLLQASRLLRLLELQSFDRGLEFGQRDLSSVLAQGETQLLLLGFERVGLVVEALGLGFPFLQLLDGDLVGFVLGLMSEIDHRMMRGYQCT